MSENKKIQSFKSLTPLEASNLIKKHADNPDLIILDVRTPWEFSNKHIEGAENMDFTDPISMNWLKNRIKIKYMSSTVNPVVEVIRLRKY